MGDFRPVTSACSCVGREGERERRGMREWSSIIDRGVVSFLEAIGAFIAT